MINLLPDTEKKLLYKEYRFRLFVVILSFILILTLVGIVLLIPSYVFVLYKENVAASEVHGDTHKTLSSDSGDFSTKIQIAKDLTTTLKPDITAGIPSDVIDSVVKDKTTNNIVSSISYVKTGQDPFIIHIIGVAATRESLIAFKESLSHVDGVAAVDLPVSNFAKDSQIPFTIDIMGTK